MSVHEQHIAYLKSLLEIIEHEKTTCMTVFTCSLIFCRSCGMLLADEKEPKNASNDNCLLISMSILYIKELKHKLNICLLV